MAGSKSDKVAGKPVFVSMILGGLNQGQRDSLGPIYATVSVKGGPRTGEDPCPVL